jgi:hypothetical protein
MNLSFDSIEDIVNEIKSRDIENGFQGSGYSWPWMTNKKRQARL